MLEKTADRLITQQSNTKSIKTAPKKLGRSTKKTEFESEGLPEGWIQIPIRNLVERVKKINPKDAPKQPYSYCDINSIDNSQFKITSPRQFLGIDAPSRARQLIKHNDILFSTVRTYLKNIAIVPLELDGQLASTGFCVLRPKRSINNIFIFYYIQSNDFLLSLNAKQRGTSYPAVRDNDVLDSHILVPPLPEQHRIVQKIESIFAQIDAAKERLERLARQTSSGSGSLSQLKSSVLKRAFEGKLVPQDPNDEPAEVLLKSIQKGSIEFENKGLPKGWVGTTLENMSDITLGRSPPSSTYNKEKRGLPFYQGKADFGDIHPTARTWCDKPQTFAEKYDILMSVRAPVGSTNISTETCSIGRGLAAIRPLKITDMMFVFYQIRRLEHTISQQGTGTTFKAITGKQVRSIPIIIPPLQEQHRIVQKIESIFARIDAIRKTYSSKILQTSFLLFVH